MRKKKKIQEISEEKGAPKTTKQTLTLTTVTGQKVQEKNPEWNIQATRNKHYKDQIIIMKILVYLTFRENPLRLYYHDNHTAYTTETTTS